MTLIEGHRPITPATGIPVWDVNPYDEAILRDPYEYYARLRELGEVVYIPRYSVLAVGRYATTHKIFADHENFLSSRGVGLNDFALEKGWRERSIILEVDPPEHTKTRKVMARVLSPKVMKTMSDLFRDTAERIVDQIIDQGTIEVVADLAEPYPTTVFPQALGMTESNRRYLVDYGAMVFNSVGPDNALRRNSLRNAGEIIPWITAACARERLTEDGMGAMVYADADKGEITHDEAGLLVRSFLSAGVDTTVTGIGNALWCLSQNPGEWDKLKADPTLFRPAFEEVLRYTSPVHTFGRTAGHATEIAGYPVEEGTKILCVLGAANMDPDKWGDPEVFRIDRKPVGHVGFGAGIHGCVGQNLARAELQALLTVMLERIDRIEPAGDPVWRPNNAIRALDKLPLKLIPK
ncbi:cytochrome P450 [Seohaeicola saemankumensis]|nr:cytochrome P450 [Seohaeicola saemankumensis]MCA0871502.1 cytochrome P450 [Seohaeicola saemankumensis]